MVYRGNTTQLVNKGLDYVNSKNKETIYKATTGTLMTGGGLAGVVVVAGTGLLSFLGIEATAAVLYEYAAIGAIPGVGSGFSIGRTVAKLPNRIYDKRTRKADEEFRKTHDFTLSELVHRSNIGEYKFSTETLERHKQALLIDYALTQHGLAMGGHRPFQKSAKEIIGAAKQMKRYALTCIVNEIILSDDYHTLTQMVDSESYDESNENIRMYINVLFRKHLIKRCKQKDQEDIKHLTHVYKIFGLSYLIDEQHPDKDIEKTEPDDVLIDTLKIDSDETEQSSEQEAAA
jgi:hypothetical protein